MRFAHLVVVLSILSTGEGVAATTAKKSPSSKKAKPAAKKSPGKAMAKAPGKNAGPAPASSAGSSTKGKAKGKAAAKKAPAATWRNRQQNPTSDRYREIQEALVAKGYLKREPDGVWDAESVSALQRFQSDQKMTPSGKINAPSLIGLGLGAKSAGATEAAPLRPPAAPPAPAASQ